MDKGRRRADSDAVPKICQAVAETFAELRVNQRDLGDRIGEKQQTISAWAKQRQPKLDDLAKMEKALNLPAGFFVRRAGYVSDGKTLKDHISAATDIDAVDRHDLTTLYEAARRRRSRTISSMRPSSK